MSDLDQREQRWIKQIEFEEEQDGTTCDSCWMLSEVYEALVAARAVTERPDVPIGYWCCEFDWNNGTFRTGDCIGPTSNPDPQWTRIRSATERPDRDSVFNAVDDRFGRNVARFVDALVYGATTERPDSGKI